MQTLNEDEATVSQFDPDWKVVLRGAALGVLRALIGTILCMIVYLAWVMSMCAPVFGETVPELIPDCYELENVALMLFAVTLYTFLCGVLVPSMIGGGAVTWILLALERSHKLSLELSAAIGCFIGGAAGFVAVILANTKAVWSFLWLLIVGVAILVGVWHSWCMARWLLRRTQPQFKDQTVSER